MEGTVAKDAFEQCGAALRPGCALLLRDVVVWRESARRLYLTVTRRTLVYLCPGTPADAADTASVLRVSGRLLSILFVVGLLSLPACSGH